MNGGLIPRHKLIDILDELAGERIIYVCAPAGYGKTVSVRQWLARNDFRSAVVTLDEFDNDLAHFCVWFCAALRDCQPENAALNEIISHPSFDSAPAQFAARALASLTNSGKARIVVDDLHFVHDEGVLRLLLSLLKRLPESFQIVLISRNEPPTDFSELLVKGRLARITADELRFSREEIVLLYKKNGISITQKQAEDIYRFTGGWAIGIGAVLLSGGDPDGENLKYLEDYIKTHVWLRWNEETREFLLKTSIVQDLTPPLCTALTGVTESGQLLDGLVQQNAFISLEKGIYRYHRLFHNCLTHILEERGEDFLHDLQSKAGYYYLSQQDFFNATECFIKCENYDGIAECFDFLEEFDRNSFVIDRALPVLRSPVLYSAAEKYPFLYLMLASAALAEGRVRDIVYCIDSYYANFPEIAQRTPALAHNIFYVRLMDFRAPLSGLLQEISSLPTALDTVGGRSTITMNMPLLHRCTRDFSEWAVPDIETEITKIFPVLGGLFGEEASLLFECMMAGLLYEQGDLDKAHIHALAANAEIKEHFAPESKFCAMSILVCVFNSLGQIKQEEMTLKRILDMIERDKAYYLTYNFSALSTRCGLVRGDMETARNWLGSNETPLDNGIDFYRLYGHFTTCWAYISVGDYDSAIILLSKVLELVTAYNRPMDIIEARILLSIACWRKKRSSHRDALQHLEQAVLLAHSYGYTQLFVNMGTELSGMLHRLQRQAEQRSDTLPAPVSFIKMLYLKTLDHQNDGLTSGQASIPIKFTDKQKAVIKLLCEGKSYREITGILGIKLPTLRSHIALIYKKLDVTNETDAVVRIKALDILGDE